MNKDIFNCLRILNDIMAFWVFIGCVMACDLPHLPPSLDFFSPSFVSDKCLEASGRFISSSLTWRLDIKVES